MDTPTHLCDMHAAKLNLLALINLFSVAMELELLVPYSSSDSYKRDSRILGTGNYRPHSFTK